MWGKLVAHYAVPRPLSLGLAKVADNPLVGRRLYLYVRGLFWIVTAQCTEGGDGGFAETGDVVMLASN